MNLNWKPKSLNDVLELNVDAVPIEPTKSYKFAGVYCFGKGLFEREELLGANTSYKNFNRLHKDHIILMLNPRISGTKNLSCTASGITGF